MEFEQELMKMMRSNARFREAVSDLLFDIFDTMEDANFSKGAFLQKFSKRERDSAQSPVDTIRRIMKSKIEQLLKTKIEESIVVDEPVKSQELAFPLRTAGELTDGGYKEHYKVNVTADPDQNNAVDKLYPTRPPAGTSDKKEKTKDPITFADFDPTLVCPDCKSPNLFNSMIQEYVECEQCDKLVLREKLVFQHDFE